VSETVFCPENPISDLSKLTQQAEKPLAIITGGEQRDFKGKQAFKCRKCRHSFDSKEELQVHLAIDHIYWV
jgi:hypothetical protein